jgi:hypothetical protein
MMMQGVPGANRGRAVQRNHHLTRVEQGRGLTGGTLLSRPTGTAGRIGKKSDRQFHIVSELAVEFLSNVSGPGS